MPNLGLRHEQLREMVNGQPNEQLVHDLQVTKNSEPTPFLRELGQKFIGACKEQKPGFEIISYYEQRKSSTVQVCVFLDEDESLLTRELTIPATTRWDMDQDRYSLAHGHSRFSLSDWPWGQLS